jgi:hypothetical protein
MKVWRVDGAPGHNYLGEAMAIVAAECGSAAIELAEARANDPSTGWSWSEPQLLEGVISSGSEPCVLAFLAVVE